jgi:predicted nuclease of predicted toxin-antitoxin system
MLIDQGLPWSTAGLLRAVRHDAVHVSEIGARDASDTQILRLAREQERVLVTLDSDFHAMLATSGARSPSVIRIRIERLRAEEIAVLLQSVMTSCGTELRDGAVVTVQAHRVRVRMLPLAE